MQFLRKLTFAAAIASAAFTGLAVVQPAHASGSGKTTEVRIETKLAGGAIGGVTPEGSARIRNRGTSSEFDVEVEHVNLPDATKLTVAVMHGTVSTTVGTLTLKLHEGELELNSRDGDLVPAVQVGDIIIVSDATNTPLLTGVLK